MKRALTPLVLLAVLAATPALAQEYSFAVPEMLFSVMVKADGDVILDYEIVFECMPGAHPIDVVDIGLPHKGYDIGRMQAFINDEPLSGIKTSTYISTGVEVPLGAQAIQPGQRGKLQFICTMPRLIYQDTTRADYASLRITPTWWGEQYVQGTTKLGIVVYFPNELGIKPEELLYHDERRPFTQKIQLDSFVSAAWHVDDHRATGEYMVGISFPKGDIPVVRMTFLGLLYKWWTDNPETRTVFAIFWFILFGIMFFRASSGTGWSCFLGLVVIFIILFASSPGIQLLMIAALPGIWYLSEKSLKRRRGKYLPAIASVEGGGIKRGLTAPEAAVVLEMPLGQVLALTVFGMLKKGILQQVSEQPLKVRVREELAVEGRRERRRAAGDIGTVLHGYEQPFIETIMAAGDVPVEKMNFNLPMKHLIKQTADRLAGFDLDKTRSYYNLIIAKAWAEAKGIGDLDKRTGYVDDNLPWLLLSPGYGDEFGYWHGRGYHYRPPWVRPTAYGGGPALPTPQAAVGGRTGFGDVAGSFAGWTQNVSGRLASGLDGAAMGLPRSGVVDLSGVDKVTLSTLEGMASGSGGGGGGGGCACAGCACACACAGGGR